MEKWCSTEVFSAKTLSPTAAAAAAVRALVVSIRGLGCQSLGVLDWFWGGGGYSWSLCQVMSQNLKSRC